MIYFSKFSDSFLEAGKRVLKVLQFGAKSADEVSPFGIDSNPIKGMTAIYSETSNDSESIIIGYINEKQLANNGELRMYSMDSNKNVKAFIWLKSNGNIELNGNNYNSVRYQPLQQGLLQLDVDINLELTKIATAITGLGGVYVPTPIQTDISLSENNTVKLS